MTESLRPGLVLEVGDLRYRVTWACRSQVDNRKVKHTFEEVFATHDGWNRALEMVRRTPPRMSARV